MSGLYGSLMTHSISLPPLLELGSEKQKEVGRGDLGRALALWGWHFFPLAARTLAALARLLPAALPKFSCGLTPGGRWLRS